MSRTLELLDKLIAFPTGSSSSNLDLIVWAAGLLTVSGFSVTRIPSPCGTKAGLYARIGPDAPGGICLSGHTDVVPTEGQNWARNPFTMTRDKRRVFGRGTTDMKGFVACVLALAERISAPELQEPLSIVLSYDEEVGCVGIKEMLPTLAPLLRDPRLVIVGEPTSMALATGHKGKVALRVLCNGTAGHSALAPRFLNAIHVASDFVAQTRLLQDALAQGPSDPAYEIPYTTLHIGNINGGHALNIVPDRVTMDMEFRHVPTVQASEVLKRIQSIARTIETKYDKQGLIDITEIGAYPGLQQTLSSTTKDLLKTLGMDPSTDTVEFGTEAGYFAQLGLNAIVIGPGDMARDGHKPDEGLDLAQLDACDRLMEHVRCGVEGKPF